MSSIVNLVYQQDKKEGSFRFHHIYVRSNAESIAFMRGESLEKKLTNEKLDDLIRTQENLILRQFILGTSVNFIDYLGAIVSYLVLSIPIFAGFYDSIPASTMAALISQNAFVSMYLISCFTKVLDMSSSISILAGTTHRIMRLIETLQFYSEQRSENSMKRRKKRMSRTSSSPTSSSLNSLLVSEDNLLFDLENVTISTRRQFHDDNDDVNKKSVLIQNLSMKFEQGHNILVWGKSGSGKTSLLRVLRGLWFPSSGKIYAPLDSSSFVSNTETVDSFHPETSLDLIPTTSTNTTGVLPSPSSEILFLPQKAITTTTGSLIQQLFYPHVKESVNDFEAALIKDYLEMFQLQHLLDYLPLRQSMKQEDGFQQNPLTSIATKRKRRKVLQHEDSLKEVDELPEKKEIDSSDRSCKELTGENDNVLWVEKLSPGEVQRIGFIRVLLSRPTAVFLDEATSSVSIETEELFYRELKRRGITCISCGHTESLKEYHDSILYITDHAEVSIQPLDHSASFL